jgi:hypothetical protein
VTETGKGPEGESDDFLLSSLSAFSNLQVDAHIQEKFCSEA